MSKKRIELGASRAERLAPRRFADDSLRHSLRNSEYPDHAALRHVFLPSDQLGHQPLLEGRVDAIAGLHRDILHAVDLEGRRRRDDARVGAEVPKLLARICVIGAEQAVIGAAAEDKSAAGGQQRSPHHRARIQGPPNALARIHVQRLDLTIERRLGVDGEVQIRDGDAGPPLSGNALFDFTFERVAVVFVRWNVNKPSLGIVGLVRPVLAAPKAGAELRRFAGGRLVRHGRLQAARFPCRCW